MYYILLNELEKPRFDLYIEGALVDSKCNVQPNIFGDGKSVKNIVDSSYSVKVNNDLSLPGKLRDRLSVYVHSSVHLFIVSESVQKLLTQSSPGQVEFYPFLFNYEETTVAEYKIVNVLNKVNCLDIEKSDVDFEDYDDNDIGQGNIYTINELVLNTSLIPPNLNIFLLGRSIDPIIIFHERLKKQIEELSLSGFVFCLPEEFQM
jgi:hypothetical protein